ncbi:MAG: hydroxymethylbilane synthase [Dehalococcoidia bacterium]|nr:hydroxymethylbilane synthase [Dehalococcoidia bacterium]
MPRLRIATRASALALVQTRLAADALRAAHPGIELEEVEVTTEGDRDRTTPLTILGGRGVFVRSVEQALLEGRADVAMHSLKDVPTEQLPGLALVAVLPRADVRDALVSRDGSSLSALPSGARVGTSSRRRVALLRALRPDLVATELRGNVDTRLRRVAEGDVDAAILAAAGLDRLGRASEVSELLEARAFLPAPGQGAIVLQCRADDASTVDLLRAIDHAETHVATDAERAVLAALGSGCSLPVGAYATIEGATIALRAMIATGEGADSVPHFEEATGRLEDGVALGREVGERLAARAGVHP